MHCNQRHLLPLMERLETRLQPARIWYPAFPDLNPATAPETSFSLVGLVHQIQQTFPISISGSPFANATVGDLDVVLTVPPESNANLSDFLFALKSPDGTTVPLISKVRDANIGGLSRVVFDDQAPPDLERTVSDSRLTPESPLGDFLGKVITGQWQLVVTRVFSSDDITILETPVAGGSETITVQLGFTVTNTDDHSNQRESYQTPFAFATPLVPESDLVYGESGAIQYPGDVDVFQWTAPEDGAFVVKLTAANNSQFYPDMYVMDEERKYIRQLNGVDNFVAHGGGLSGNAEVMVTAVKGVRYLISVGDNRGRNLGTYRVTLERFADDHPNEPLNPAVHVIDTLNRPSLGTINRPGDTDWFKVSIPGESGITKLIIDKDNLLGGSFTLYRRSIQDESKNSGVEVVISGGLNGTGTISREFYREEGISYYLRFFECQSGNYAVSFEYSQNVDDHGNSPANATSLILGTDLTVDAGGLIEFSGDMDVFALPMIPQGMLADIRVTSEIPFEVAVVDEKGAVVAQQASAGNRFQLIRAAIDLTGSYAQNENGTYGFRYFPDRTNRYLALRSPTGLTGNYSLQIIAIPYTADSNDDPADLPAFFSIQGPIQTKPRYTISHATDADWYSYTAPRDGSLAIFCNPLSNDLRLEISVNESINSIQSERMDSSRRNNKIFGMSFDVSAGKTYQIRVKDLQCGSGEYELEMTFLNREEDTVPNNRDDYFELFYYRYLNALADAMSPEFSDESDSFGGVENVSDDTNTDQLVDNEVDSADLIQDEFLDPIPPDFAHFVPSDGGLTGRYSGRLDYQGDIDMIEWLAPVSGLATYSMSAQNISGDVSALFPDIYVSRVISDQDGFPVSFQLEASSGGPFAGISTVQFPVIAGKTYLISNGDNHGRGIGPFVGRISVIGDDYANSVVGFSSALGFGNYSIAGTENPAEGFINQPGDIDLFQFTVPTNGTYFLQMASGSHATGSILDRLGNPVPLKALVINTTYYAAITGNQISRYQFIVTSVPVQEFVLSGQGSSISSDTDGKSRPSTFESPLSNILITKVITEPNLAQTKTNTSEVGRNTITIGNTTPSLRDEKIKEIGNTNFNSSGTLFLDYINGANTATIDIGRQEYTQRDATALELRGVTDLVHTGSIQLSVSQEINQRGFLSDAVVQATAPLLDQAVSILDGTEHYGVKFSKIAMSGLTATTSIKLWPWNSGLPNQTSWIPLESSSEHELPLPEDAQPLYLTSIVVVSLFIFHVYAMRKTGMNHKVNLNSDNTWSH